MKSIRIKCEENGDITISGPMKLRNHEIRQLIEDYEDSIDQLKEAIAMMKYQNRPDEGVYWVLGKKEKCQIIGNTAYLGSYQIPITKKGFDQDHLHQIYAQVLKDTIDEIRDECYQLTGEQEEVLSFYNYRRRHGTCYPQKREIRLSYSLAKRTPEEIKFVYLHECCHFKHPNHSKEFYKELKSLVTNYEEMKQKLKE